MDALLLGRRTYEIFAGCWPSAPEEPFAGLLNRVPKYVASRTLFGSLDLVQTRLREGLVDRVAPRRCALRLARLTRRPVAPTSTSSHRPS